MLDLDFDSVKSLISIVAIYLRKSRGEDDSVLDKHRRALVDICLAKDWSYVIYAEIGTSDSIVLRPEMTRLLDDIENNMYSGVMVLEIDRLSRSDEEDFGRIKNACIKTDTLVITPHKIFNLDDDRDAQYFKQKAFFANNEYDNIKMRFKFGKVQGARRGDWTNGSGPFPYEYERWGDKYVPNRLVVNDDKNKIYQYMKKLALAGMTNEKIAWELNRLGYKTAKGNTWRDVSVQRVLYNETLLGKTISNKTRGDAHKIKKNSSKPFRVLPRSQWYIVENCHEAVITQEEFDKIQDLNRKRQLVGTRARSGVWALSGLLKCGLCGATLGFNPKNNGNHQIKPCYVRDDFGNKICSNRGGLISTAIDEINAYIERYRESLLQNPDVEVDDTVEISSRLNDMYTLRTKYENAAKKAKYSYDLGEYTKQDWLESKAHWDGLIEKVNGDIGYLERQIRASQKMTNEERLELIERLIDDIKNAKEPKVLNDIYKSVIDVVRWTRIKDEEPIVELDFL
ncbi:MAG: recombinase family protein [Firmicutes bacterium]|nr:recombinase family protein [Bacillota bacterium]